MSDSIKRSNTGKEKSAVEKTTVKKKGLTQLEINIIEARLTLGGGTLPQELGSSLANKFGSALKKINDATTALSYLDKIRDIDKRKTQTVVVRQNLEAAKIERQEEVGSYTKLAMDYIQSEYGAEIRNESNRLVGYGDQIEITRDKHLKKVW